MREDQDAVPNAAPRRSSFLAKRDLSMLAVLTAVSPPEFRRRSGGSV